ncbi:hypothetical protein [Povalibacter sp.]|uniref:hypothetical protein n=1 Tax=Povalibacter sp. TaxID=1962978 RepID=UPI002F3F4108
MNRVIKGFLLAPLAGLVVGAFVSSLVFAFGNLGGFGYAFLMVLGGAFFTYPFLIVVGVPLFFVLRRFGALSFPVLLVVGALFGAIGWLVAASPIPSPEFYLRAVSEGVFGLASGLVGAATFWVIVVREEAP